MSLTREQNNKEHVVGGRMLLPDAIYRNDFISDALVSMLERSLNEMLKRKNVAYPLLTILFKTHLSKLLHNNERNTFVYDKTL